MKTNRWAIAVAGDFLQIALGAVYAWSVFRVPLAKQFGWSISEVTLTFTISIFVLGLASFFGGLWLNRKGPRVVALVGGLLYGGGVFRSSSGFGQVVPRATRVDYWHCSWWVRSRCSNNRSSGNGTHSELRRSFDLRLSRHRISHRDRNLWLFHAESA